MTVASHEYVRPLTVMTPLRPRVDLHTERGVSSYTPRCGPQYPIGTRVQIKAGYLAPLTDEERREGLSLLDFYRYPGIVTMSWEEGWNTLVRFDGEWEIGSILGCELLTLTEWLEVEK